MNVEHIPAEDVDVLPCGADWQSRHLESEKRKAEIRDRIHKQAEQGQKTAKDYFRPAKPTPSIYDSDLKRVAVYARVSTSSEEQISSIENQTLYYTKKIAETENWNLQDIYSDEGKSGTSLRKRDAFKRMMRDAKDQKMDSIICASISRFARNFSDCMTQIAALKTMHPAHPIGVYFETENIYTLNPSSQYSLDIQALLADWESGNKSRRMILSYDQRIMTGQYPVADLMGYRHTKDGRLVIEPEEAKTVRFIFLAFIQGYNYDQIAAVLTQKKRSTLRGRQEWNGMMVANIMKNERRWGDLEARKSIVVDYKLGKVTKNNGNRCSAYVMQKKGMYLGGYRPFGFLSDPNDCHKLILDPVASRYVRLIFELALQGNRTGTIAKILNEKQTPTPAAYHVAENHVYSEQKAWDLQRSHWTSGTVYHVLKNEKYKGTYVGAKFIMPVPCKHRVLRAPLEQQVRIEDSHATIVTPEEFEQAQIQNRNFRLL